MYHLNKASENLTSKDIDIFLSIREAEIKTAIPEVIIAEAQQQFKINPSLIS
jgi:hypothetical protein